MRPLFINTPGFKELLSMASKYQKNDDMSSLSRMSLEGNALQELMGMAIGEWNAEEEGSLTSTGDSTVFNESATVNESFELSSSGRNEGDQRDQDQGVDKQDWPKNGSGDSRSSSNNNTKTKNRNTHPSSITKSCFTRIVRDETKVSMPVGDDVIDRAYSNRFVPRIGDDLPRNYVPLKSNNKRDLKSNVNLQHFRRLVKKRQQAKGRAQISETEKQALKEELRSTLQQVHWPVQLPDLEFVVEAESVDKDDGTMVFRGCHYRRAYQSPINDEFANEFTENHNFSEFLPPLDTLLVQQANAKYSDMVVAGSPGGEGMLQFVDMVAKLRDILAARLQFRDILEDGFVRLINEVWNKIADTNSRSRTHDPSPSKKRRLAKRLV